MRRLRTIVIVASFGIAVAVAACASLSGLSGGPSGEPEAGVAPEAAPLDAAPSDPCHHAKVVAAPVTDDDPTGDVGPVVLAVRSVSVAGALDGGGPIGFDLDGVCTCFPDPSTAHGAQPSCVPPDGSMVACDQDGGVDRQLTNVIAGYPLFFGGKSADNGGPSLVMTITKYNGRANDAEVFLAAFGSEGIFDATGCAGDPDGPPFKATWQGCDKWTLDSRYVLPGTTEPTAYLTGYVTNHVLVARSSVKPLAFLAGNIALPIASAVVTARLVAVGPTFVPIEPPPDKGDHFQIEEGVLSGRVTTGDALRGLASQQADSDGGPLCGFPNFFTAVKTGFVCPNADITSSVAKDFTNAPCDAISVAAAFSAFPAQIGAVRDPKSSACAAPDDPKFDALFDCAK